VTLVLAATGRFPWRDAGPYVVAQLIGSVVGGLLIVAAFGPAAVDLGNVGGVAFGDGVGYAQAITAEALGTFLLVLTIMALAVDRRAPAGWAGWMIGLSVTGLILVFGPLTGAAVNPARAFGPNAGAALFGGEVDWTQFPAYVIGSLLGGLAAALCYDLIARPRDAEPGPDAASQGTQGEVVGKRV
jgi:glycerol uptake facilitator protein